MKKYLILWLILTGALCGVIYALTLGWESVSLSTAGILYLASAIAAILVANEMKRPEIKEYHRQKALYPKIPEEYLYDAPPTGGMVFGMDYHTNKLVGQAGHHTLIIGSTGSGKTSCSLLPSILSNTKGSAQVVDIKARELALKASDIYDPKTIIIDLDRKAPYAYGWDVFYKLKRDGTDTEQDALKVIREVASIIIPKATSGDQFWNDSARALFTGLSLYEICYAGNYEFIDVLGTLMTVPLRDHIEMALNACPRTSLVASYLTSLSTVADETLFSADISMCTLLYEYMAEEIVWALRDNPKRANPQMLNEEGVKQFLCISEEKLDSGFARLMNVIMKQTLVEIQSRTSTRDNVPICLYWDEYQKLTESCDDLRAATCSFLKTARSKNCALTMVMQNIDRFDKQMVFDIISNVHFLLILSSNNSASLTTEIATKMAGSYYEKNVSFSENKGSSTTTSFTEKPVLKPEDLNNLGDDAVLIITNYGYVRVNKSKVAYYKHPFFKPKYERIIAVNREAMNGV